MQNINWVQVIVGFLGGGAFGAFIKQFFDNRRNRIQPVAHSIEIKSFYNSGDNKLINSEVILRGVTNEYKFSKLYTGTIEIVNTGLTDYADFSFGVTTSKKIKFIQINPTTSDRHHTVELSPIPTVDSQVNNFDIGLKPFNRKDKYTFDLLFTTEETSISQTDIHLSSASPIKWVRLVSPTEFIIEVGSNTIIEIIASRVKGIFRL